MGTTTAGKLVMRSYEESFPFLEPVLQKVCYYPLGLLPLRVKLKGPKRNVI